VEQAIISGRVALLTDKWSSALILGMTEKPSRSVSSPEKERVIQGPKESFSESLRLNMGLMRSRMQTIELKTEAYSVGALSKTKAVLMYIESAMDDALLQKAREVFSRFSAPHLNHISDFDHLVERHPWSPFPQTLLTERPDVVAGNLLEGRVAFFAEGTPGALIAPIRFGELFQSPEDYYTRPLLAIAIRWLRLLAFVMTLTAVPLYVALVSYHYDIIPFRMLVQIAASRSNLVFSPVTEALVLDIGVELLREAGIRLPRALGQTLSVAAALVIGQSVLAANVVSPLLVVAVGATSLASFVIPNYSTFLSLRLLRFFFTIMAGFA
jgi:spore germination protein KA